MAVSTFRWLPTALLYLACSAEAEPGPPLTMAECRIVQQPSPLPRDLEESSGIAVSQAHEGVLWSHNDSGGEPSIYAVDVGGRLLGETRLRGASNGDWEDIAVAPCVGGSCVYIADTGDNEHQRDDLAIYRLLEPTPGTPRAEAQRFRIRFPVGRPDVEAMFVLPTGEIFLVTRGRGDDQMIFRYPLPLRENQRVMMVPVSTLAHESDDNLRHITSASATRSGEWVAIRTYKGLSIFRAAELRAGGTRPAVEFDLTAVREVQGEGVHLLDTGGVILTSEAGFSDGRATIAVLQCDLPAVSSR